MGKLSKGIYGFETSPKKTPFGFLNEQKRLDSVINNAGWYNHLGEKLGTGDLSIKDMEKIKSQISEGDIFFVMNEFNSFWGVPEELDKSAPGMDYIHNNVSWIIFSKGILRIREDISNIESADKDGVSYIKTPKDIFLKSVKNINNISENKKSRAPSEDIGGTKATTINPAKLKLKSPSAPISWKVKP